MRYSGETVDAALNKGLADLNVGRDQVEVRVISEGRKGFLGIGRKAAEVEIMVLISNNETENQSSDQLGNELISETRKDKNEQASAPQLKDLNEDQLIDDALQVTGNYLDDIINQLGINTEISVTIDRRNIYFDFDTDQQGLLIGKHGRTLNALQILAQACFDKQVKRRYRVVLDVGNYRERRCKELQRIAVDLAERAITEQRAFKLGPMPAIERKIVHKTLASNKHVKAKSHGNDPYRYIVIAPKL